jgi:transcriptional regulator with PAS, ATPase and Fis domain
MEREAITEALRRANGNKSHAAIALGLSRTRFSCEVWRAGCLVDARRNGGGRSR